MDRYRRRIAMLSAGAQLGCLVRRRIEGEIEIARPVEIVFETTRSRARTRFFLSRVLQPGCSRRCTRIDLHPVRLHLRRGVASIVLTSAPSNDLSATGGFRGLPCGQSFGISPRLTRRDEGPGRRTPRAIRRTIRVPTHRHAEITQEISRLGQKLVSKPSASGPGNTGASPNQGRRAVYSTC
jgi:hypothetical protein